MNNTLNRISIQNIEEYTQQIINGELVLTRIIPVIDEVCLFQKNLKGSFILDCKINNININIHKYKKLLIYLYSSSDIETIFQNTILNISREELYDKGFEYYNQLDISIQGADSRRTLKEIINIVKILHYNIELKIQLKNNEVIHFII